MTASLFGGGVVIAVGPRFVEEVLQASTTGFFAVVTTLGAGAGLGIGSVSLYGARLTRRDLVFAFATQAITGIFLWMCYSPGSQNAWESVYYIQYEMWGGWLLRGIHHYTAQAMVVLLLLHLMQVVIDGAYIPAGTKRVNMADVYHGYIANVESQEFEVPGCACYSTRSVPSPRRPQ